jgi:peptide/nickel transport system substrate-binding protein
MRRATLVATTSVTVVALLTGCTSTSPSTPSAANDSNLTATTAVARNTIDTVNWNLPNGEPSSLDFSYTWDTGSGNTVLANLCDSLMRQTPAGTIEPGLAQSVTTPDSTTYVYTLRSGVTFTDGKPMTADDVVFSLNRQMDPNTAAYWSLWFANVASISATSPTQVTVKLKKSDVLFGEVMATPAGAVAEKAYVVAQGKNYGTPAGGVMCTGPYSLKKWVSGTSITLEANPHYWDPNLQPKARTFVFTFLRDPSTITNGLITGSIDGTWQAPLSGVTRLRSASDGTLFMNNSTFFSGFEMVSFAGALKNVKVRQALRAVIDYRGIATGILQATGTPAAAAATSSTWGYAKDIFSKAYAALPPAKQDLTKAASLLSEAGIPTQPIVLGVDAGNAAAVAAVTSIQDSARKVGLAVTVKPYPTAAYQGLFFDAKARAGLDGLFATTTADIPDPLELYIQLIPSSSYNFTGYDNHGFTQPITQATSISDPAQRATLITQAQASFADQVQLLPVFAQYELLFMNKKITGPAVSTLGYLYYPWAATVGAP